MKKDKDILETASDSIKQTLVGAEWWQYVQPEVRNRLNFVVSNLGTMAIPFRDSFVHTFRFEHARRMVEHQSVERKVPGSLFGKSLPEEVYQSGILPAKMLLGLNDWSVPNEADVQACMHVCAQIDVFETMGAIENDLDEATTNSLDFLEKKRKT